MPINLQNEQNIGTGWPGPPQLHAPEIGSLVGAILRNRLGQQELTQKSVSDAIKQMQEQRDNEAFMKAAQQAGIIPQGDYGGLSAKSGVGLASAIAAQTKDTEMDRLHKAMADAYEARTKFMNGGGDEEDGGHALGETWIGPDGLRRIMTPQGPKISQLFTQPADVRATPQRPPTMKDYTQGIGISGLDLTQQWPTDDPNLVEIPAINPDYEYGKPGAASQKYLQVPNPKFDSSKPPSVTNPPTISHTVRVPKTEIDRWKLGGSAETEDQTNLPAAPSSITPGPAAPNTVVPDEPNQPVTRGEKIDPATAQQYLIKAHGNKAVAQRMAQSAGWTW